MYFISGATKYMFWRPGFGTKVYWWRLIMEVLLYVQNVGILFHFNEVSWFLSLGHIQGFGG
jgi:hypothetical protein